MPRSRGGWSADSAGRPSRVPKVILSFGHGFRERGSALPTTPPRSSRRLMRNWEAEVRILLVPNPLNSRSVEAVQTVAEHLANLGYVPVLETADAELTGLPLRGVPRAEIGAPQLAIALGGDGTILKAVHLLGACETPVLGINLGRLGFLSGAQGDGLLGAVEAAVAGEGRIETRQTMEASVIAGGRPAGTYRALNEIFIGRSGAGRGVELEVSANGEPLYRYIGDGAIVATPTGSTAYSLSAGGPILAPDVRGLIFTAVSPHLLGVRPIVFGPSDRITVACPNPVRADACITVDGDGVPCRTTLDRVEMRVAEQDVRLLKLDGRDFYSVLATSFFGG